MVFDFLKVFFRNKRESQLKGDSSQLSINTDSVKGISGPQSKTKYRVASCQSSGRERSHNEDAIFTLNSFFDSLDTSSSFGIFLIADGMGGHQSGEVASRLAAQATSQYLIKNIFNRVIYERAFLSDSDLREILRESVKTAQTMIKQRVPGGGTTLTLVLVLGDRLNFVHVGDCRLYTIDLKGNMKLETRDHSLVKRLIDLGELAEIEAVNHPQRNVLYRALGQEDPLDPDFGVFSLEKGERFLICSDGLWGVIEEQQIMEIINEQEKALEQIVCDLVDAANQAGGPDNISLVLVERLV